MKKFRLIIQVTSFIFIALTILIGLNGEQIATEGLAPFWPRGYITFLENSLNWWTFGLTAMMIQLILENIQIASLKGELQEVRDELGRLNSQLKNGQLEDDGPKKRNKVALVILVAYFIYTLVTILVNLYLEEMINMGVYTFFKFIITWGVVGLVVVSLRFIVDFNRIAGLKRNLKTSEDEVVHLKARLYDQQNNPKSEVAGQTDETPDSNKTDDSGSH